MAPFNPAPFAHRSGKAQRNAQRDGWEPAPRYALALLPSPGRNERRESGPSRTSWWASPSTADTCTRSRSTRRLAPPSWKRSPRRTST
jgi:hypothetical protein